MLKQCFLAVMVVASYTIFFVLGSFFASSTTATSNGSAQEIIEKCRLSVQNGISHHSFMGCLLCELPRSHSSGAAGGNVHLRQHHDANLQTTNNSVGTVATPGKVSENKAAFDKIYSGLVWSDAGGGSGVGSDPEFAKAAGYILQLIVNKYGITSLLDAPCGAVSNSWTRQVIIQLSSDIPCFRYHGVDVVESVIQKNTAAFAAARLDRWAKFSQADLSLGSTMLPKGYEIILSRDALQHLTYKGIAGAVDTYCRSDARYLLVGSYLDLNENKDLASGNNVGAGGCFSINLRQAPFSFPEPLEAYAEKGKSSGPNGVVPPDPYPRKHLLLYRLKDLCQSQSVTTFIATHKN
jgi:hypothetical protein